LSVTSFATAKAAPAYGPTVIAIVRRLASMPRSVRLSLWLFLGGVALGFAMFPFDPRQWPPRPEAPVLIIAIFLGAALFGALAFVALRTYQGRNWARWVQLVLTVAALPGAIRDAIAHLGGAPVITTIYAAIFCAEIVAVALLFTRTSSLWYRHASAGSPAS
jgi:hypothetical protein